MQYKIILGSRNYNCSDVVSVINRYQSKFMLFGIVFGVGTDVAAQIGICLTLPPFTLFYSVC